MSLKSSTHHVVHTEKCFPDLIYSCCCLGAKVGGHGKVTAKFVIKGNALQGFNDAQVSLSSTVRFHPFLPHFIYCMSVVSVRRCILPWHIESYRAC